jgi:hypothetical protein
MKSLSILFTALLGLIPLLHAAHKPNLSVSDSLQQTNTPDKARYVPVPLHRRGPVSAARWEPVSFATTTRC